jgi:hypothetical protein
MKLACACNSDGCSKNVVDIIIVLCGLIAELFQ